MHFCIGYCQDFRSIVACSSFGTKFHPSELCQWTERQKFSSSDEVYKSQSIYKRLAYTISMLVCSRVQHLLQHCSQSILMICCSQETILFKVSQTTPHYILVSLSDLNFHRQAVAFSRDLNIITDQGARNLIKLNPSENTIILSF